MAAYSAYRVEYMDIVNESDESDQEYVPPAGKYSGSQNTIEELLYEMDVAKYYKKLSESLVCQSSRSSRTAVKSEAVQTEPEQYGIPPTWLIAGQKLVSELHTGIANMMNTLYHTPNGYCKDGGMNLESNLRRLKHFRFVDGCWQSKLLPKIKIPASGLERQINSKVFKNELNTLLEKASLLKYIIPYVAECDIETELKTAESEIKNRENNLSTTEVQNPNECYQCGEAGHSMPDVVDSGPCSRIPRLMGSCVNITPPAACSNCPETSDSDSVKSGYSSQSGTSGCLLKTSNRKKELPQVVPNRKCTRFGESSAPKSNQGVIVSKYDLPPRECRCVQLPVPKRSAVQKAPRRDVESVHKIQSDSATRSGLIIVGGKISCSRRKPLTPVTESDASHECPSTSGNVLKSYKEVKSSSSISQINGTSNQDKKSRGQENCTKGQSVSSGHKNFIKRNILALKAPVIRPTASRSKQGHMKI